MRICLARGRPFRFVSVLLVAAVLGAACGGSDDSDGDNSARSDEPEVGEPRGGGTIVDLESGFEPTSLDPAKTVPTHLGRPNGTAAYNVYDNLVRVDPLTGEVAPRIAESLESNDDQTEWTITLREGVTFTDDTPYDADAVIFNWDRQKDPAVAGLCRTTVLDMQYRAEDRNRIVVSFEEGRASFPELLEGCLSSVASPAALEQFGESYGTSPETVVGAGPFVLTEWAQGDHLTFVRNPDFWDQPRPYLDGMTIRSAPDHTQAANAIISGTVDVGSIITGLSQSAIDSLEGQPGIELAGQPQQGSFALQFNTSRAPLDDVRVRKALVMAFDAEDFNEKIGGGSLDMAETYFTEDSRFYNPDITQTPGDLGAAQELIDEYVAETGGPVELTIVTSSTLEALHTLLQQQWSRLSDVTVELEVVESVVPRLQSGDYQLTFTGIGTHSTPESLYNQYHSGSVGNVTGYSDPTMDGLLTDLRTEDDPDAQQELYDRITEFLISDQNWILMTYRIDTIYAYDQTKLAGLTRHDPQGIDWSAVWRLDG